MGYNHITIFDQPYPEDKQAEGIAVSEAVATGRCHACGYLRQCERDQSFKPPVLAWCQQRKSQILKGWK